MSDGIELIVNGQARAVTVDPGELLVDVLRERLGLRGTKKGCGTGDCGACTVLMDGKAVNSCLVLAHAAQGSDIVTIEGLSPEGALHPIQQAFIEQGAVQCGFCTPGMVLATKALLDENAEPTETEMRAALAGNICRCTGYGRIFAAVRALSSRKVIG
jgi:carbon-monoxide dehydrogenase small subunit